jgi:hypothetical protein
MRYGDKGMSVLAGENQLLGVDFHDRIQKEHNGNSVELASEFGLDLRKVKKLKKQLERN